jgi:hypothetical protein
MVVCFAIRANKAEDTRIFGADKQAADAANFIMFGVLLVGGTHFAPLAKRDATTSEPHLAG